MYYGSAVRGHPLDAPSYPRSLPGRRCDDDSHDWQPRSYQEINLRAAIDRRDRRGPDIIVTGPYLQGRISSG